MTLYGLDVSHYQGNAGLHLGTAKGNGFQFVMAKASEGQGVKDPHYREFHQQAKDNHMLFAAYHFLHSDSSAQAQADNCASVVNDKSIPIMIDCEPSGSSRPNISHCRAFRSAMEAKGYRVTMLYYPHFHWVATSPSLKGWNVVQALYGRNSVGSKTAEYPGDHSASWNQMGGVTPTILQFSSSVKMANYSNRFDADAFRGTRAELAAKHLFKDYAPAPKPAPKPKPKPKPAPKKPSKPLPPTRITEARKHYNEGNALLAAAVKEGRTGSVRIALAAIKTALRLLPKR